MDFDSLSCSYVVGKLESPDKCDTCLSVDLLKLHICRAGCLADSVNEQQMTADKLTSDLNSNPGEILSDSLKTQHLTQEPQMARVGRILAEIKAKMAEIPRRRRIEAPVKQKKAIGTDELGACLSKLAYLEEKASSLDSSLAVRAAETYDLKEEAAAAFAQMNPTPSPALFDEVAKLKQETSNLTATLEGIKFKNDGVKLDTMHARRMKTSMSSSRVHNQIKLLEDSRPKSDLQAKLKKLDETSTTIAEQMRSNYEQVSALEAEIRWLQLEKTTVYTMNPSQMIECSHTIFSSYNQMKEKTNSTLTLLSKLDLQDCPTFRKCLQEVKGLL